VRRKIFDVTRRYGADAVIVALCVLSIVEYSVDDVGNKKLFLPLALFWSLPLLLRRRAPLLSPLIVFAAIAVGTLADANGLEKPASPFFCAIAACVVAGAVPDRRLRPIGLVVAYGVVTLVVSLVPGNSAGDLLWIGLFITAAWAVGNAIATATQRTHELRERTTQLERDREEKARAAVAEERARIARELHDVVGHSVSVMTVQASAVRRLLRPDQEQEREALRVVEETGRQALAEMRRMVGVLRRPEEAPALAPQPSLVHLDRLVEHVREAGLAVALHVEGEPKPLAPGVDLTAYRLVQEGLTNALKHAQASRADVTVRYSDGEVQLVVADNGKGSSNGSTDGGHGLVGMKERVSVYGGDLEAGPAPAGGFVLRARLPVG
jgi:signal transduction histidine kinase